MGGKVVRPGTGRMKRPHVLRLEVDEWHAHQPAGRAGGDRQPLVVGLSTEMMRSDRLGGTSPFPYAKITACTLGEEEPLGGLGVGVAPGDLQQHVDSRAVSRFTSGGTSRAPRAVARWSSMRRVVEGAITASPAWTARIGWSTSSADACDIADRTPEASNSGAHALTSLDQREPAIRRRWRREGPGPHGAVRAHGPRHRGRGGDPHVAVTSVDTRPGRPA